MATLAVAVAVRTGIDMAGVAATSGGDQFPNTGREYLQIFNGDSGSHTVTPVTQLAPDGQTVSALTVAVPAGATKVIGPFPPGVYNDVNGNVQLTYSAVTSVTVKVVQVTPQS